MKRLLLIFALIGAIVSVSARETLSLKHCIAIGIDNNLSLKMAEGEVRKGKQTISENRAKLLPQINAVAGFNDNFDPPVSVTDGTAYGKKYNITV